MIIIEKEVCAFKYANTQVNRLYGLTFTVIIFLSIVGKFNILSKPKTFNKKF